MKGKNTAELKCVVCTAIFQSHFVEKSCEPHKNNSNKLDIILNQLFDLFCRHVLSPQSIKKLGFEIDLTRRKKEGNYFGSINQHNFPFCPTCRDQITTLSILNGKLEKIQKNILEIVTNLISKILKSVPHIKTTKQNSVREPRGPSTGHVELTSRLHNDLAIKSDRLEKLREIIVQEWRPIIKLQQLPHSFRPQKDASCSIQDPTQVPETSFTPLFCKSESENMKIYIFSPSPAQLPPSPDPLDSTNVDIDIEASSPNPSVTDEVIEGKGDKVQVQLDSISAAKTKKRKTSRQDKLSKLSTNGNVEDPQRKKLKFDNWTYDYIMSTPKSFECRTCGVIEDNENNMWTHIQRQHSIRKEPYVNPKALTWPTCPVCKRKKASKYNLARHVRKVHPTGIDIVLDGENEDAHSVECSPGQFAFGFGQEGKTLAYKIIEHPFRGHGFECLICQHFAQSHSKIAHHIRNIHNIRKGSLRSGPDTKKIPTAIVRSIDGKLMFDGKFPFEKLTGNDQLEGTHRQLQPNRFKCGTCDHVETGWTKFKYHMTRKHAIQDYICDTCGKCFKHIKNLRQHLRSHDPSRSRVIKKMLCDICGKPCTGRGSLMSHKLRVHRDESQVKNHACSKCLKKFYTNQELRKHETCHSQETKFLCQDCPRKFKYYAALYRHRKSSHSVDGLKPYTCPHCPMRFTQHQSIRRHVENIHESKGGRSPEVKGSGMKRKRTSRTNDIEEEDWMSSEEAQVSTEEQQDGSIQNEN